MSLADDRQLFGLDEGYSAAQLHEAYLRLARLHHPDHGGDLLRFQDVCRAHKALRAALETRPCSKCQGKGEIMLQRGFQIGTMRCAVCRGTGKERNDGR